MSMAMTTGVDLTLYDASGQRKFSLNGFPKSATIQELIRAACARMGLSLSDNGGRSVEYQAFNKTDGYHLRGTETVGETLTTGDEVTLLPDIQAGLYS